MNKKIATEVALGVIIIVVLVVGAVVWLGGKSVNDVVQTQPAKTTPAPVAQQPATNQPAIAIPDETANWKVFTSKQEGFTLKYPATWTLQNGDNVDCGETGAGCPDRVTFTSPDGIMVRYTKETDKNNDKLICGLGTGAPCMGNNILSLETFNVQNLGQVYLVKEDKSVFLDLPSSQDTIPVVGENKHTNFDLDFNLPSKNGGRYELFLTVNYANDGTTKFDKLTNDQFYNLESVKQAILMMKSLSY